MYRILLNVIHTLWRTDVICESTDWCLMAGHIVILPFSKETNNEVSSELSSEDLGEEVDVGNECSLEDDWDVGGIEQFDWIWLLESSHLSAAQT